MKKGFTLIELLAVIVILAIIAVIAVPIVINIIKESKENATLRSGEFYLDAVELSIARAKLNNKNISNGTYNIKNGNICLNTDCTDILEVEVNGDAPESGSIIISNGKIVEGTTITFKDTSFVLNNNKLSVSESSVLLSSIILGENKANVVSSGDGLYLSTATNDGSPTYYFKGNVDNNYVEFAGYTWRVVRINEDGTIRLIAVETDVSSCFNTNDDLTYKYMYYSESNVEWGIKKDLIDWYSTNLFSYDSYISIATYCEALKVGVYSAGNVTPLTTSEYVSDFRCPEDDDNGYGLITDQKIGLITVDEVLLAGGSFDSTSSYYLSNYNTWTISPAGTRGGSRYLWYVNNGVVVIDDVARNESMFFGGGVPVISLNANVTVEESNGNGVHGSSTNPYVIKTN